MEQSGFIGGGQVGYNYLISSRYLLGLETDIQGSSISGTKNISGYGLSASNFNRGFIASSSAAAIGQSSVEGGVNWLSTVRARLGYLVTPTILIYVPVAYPTVVFTQILTLTDYSLQLDLIFHLLFGHLLNNLRAAGVTQILCLAIAQVVALSG